MSDNTSRHIDWLPLIETSGPFLTVPVLEDAFPQRLDVVDATIRSRLKAGYDEWSDEIENNADDPTFLALHDEWIRLVLTELLEYDNQCLVKIDKSNEDAPFVTSIENLGKFYPQYAIIAPFEKTIKLFIAVAEPGTDLRSNKCGDDWPEKWQDRMILLCRKYKVRLGLLTNGEQWMLVNAPYNSSSGTASWYARFWFHEPNTLRAFFSLLNIRRTFGPPKETLEALLDESLKHYEEITDTLGLQVRRAVEVLVQGLDRANEDRNHELLLDIESEPTELYEAGLTIMMRLVFLLCAEERKLLLLGESQYDEYYSVSTLRGQLEETAGEYGEEILDHRYDAYTRLLAVFRAIYGGIDFENLHLSALGGSLFDPDRFPFLEGRAKGTSWKECPALPLPIDNRTVLLLLNSLQLLEQRGGALLLSYKALDVEQIGYVYEGLLEHTVIRSEGITLGLQGSIKAKNPNVSLGELESARMDGMATLVNLIKQKTERGESAIKNDLAKTIDKELFSKIIGSCRGNIELTERIKPFARLLRVDAWNELIVYPDGAFMVTMGQDRRETGTHYTPRSFTEMIVKNTLEPLVFIGPSEGDDQKSWKLKSSDEILDLKICDPAMGSGAFLVQVCRYLAEKLVEAWRHEEINGILIDEDGAAYDELGDKTPLTRDTNDRLIAAKNLIAERCLYGVDINPLAVELAKVSVWLETFSKGRPFGFLDHNFRSGDSLLGLYDLRQLACLTLKPEEHFPRLLGDNIETAVNEAIRIRKQIRAVRIRDIHDVETMYNLDIEARHQLVDIELLADAVSGAALASGGNEKALDASLHEITRLAGELFDENYDKLNDHRRNVPELLRSAQDTLSVDLPPEKPPRRPLHWVLNFPEVFEAGGFDGIVGNPPFMGGKKISTVFGNNYLEYLKFTYAPAKAIDMVGFFFRRNFDILKQNCSLGCLATNSIAQGDTREGSLEVIEKKGGTITMAIKSMPWPGTAAVSISVVAVYKGKWQGIFMLDGATVPYISSFFDSQFSIGNPYPLNQNMNISFVGSFVLGMGFVLTPEEGEKLIAKDPKNEDVIYPYLNGEDLNSKPDQSPSRMVINFKDWPLDSESAEPDYYGPVVEDYPDCLEIVEKLVKPERTRLDASGNYVLRKPLPQRWWHYADKRPALYRTIAPLDRVMVVAQVSKTLAFEFVDNDKVLDAKLIVFAFEKFSYLGIMQSVFHFLWAWKYCTTMKEDLSYTPTAIFQTFPFPQGLEPNNKNQSNPCMVKLETLGEQLYNSRKEIMLRLNIGLTKLYNLYHAKKLDAQVIMTTSNCDKPNADWVLERINKLRDLQKEIDKTVLAAYGWDEMYLEHGFYELEFLPENDRLRYTVSEHNRLEILRRLLALNHERHKEEFEAGLVDKDGKPLKKKSKKGKINSGDSYVSEPSSLFDAEERGELF
jgi:hypothetical protein